MGSNGCARLRSPTAVSPSWPSLDLSSLPLSEPSQVTIGPVLMPTPTPTPSKRSARFQLLLSSRLLPPLHGLNFVVLTSSRRREAPVSPETSDLDRVKAASTLSDLTTLRKNSKRNNFRKSSTAVSL